jgi:hypothetical protein
LGTNGITTAKAVKSKTSRMASADLTPPQVPLTTFAYLILDSRNSTCFLATGSYFFFTNLSVIVREFFRVT